MRVESRTVAVSLILALVTVTTVAGWLAWSSRAADNVFVSWSPASPDCEGTTVQRPRSQPIINARDTMHCVVEVSVANRGTRTVHVVRGVARFVGPETGTVVKAENASAVAHSGLDIDAVFPLGADLGGGESMTFEVVLVFNPGGCNEGGTMRLPGWPFVTVEALGRSHDVHSDQTFAFQRRGTTPGCRT
jgi:hypothetical protein